MPTPQPQKATPPLAVQPSRMSLASVVKGKIAQPVRCVLYGVEGIGKSTFGANAPAPIFLGAENGTAQLDVTRFPAPETWQEVLDAVRLLERETHPYRTLVVDTLDWAEPLLWAYVCKRDGKKDIEDYGFGKGYNTALDEWRVFLAALERLCATKAVNIILVAHSIIRTFKNPEGEDYDRYEMKLNAKAAGLIREWSDAVLFANYETYANKDKKTSRVKGVDTGARLIYTNRRAAYDAKNRYSLPDSLPLDWAEFAAAVSSGEVAAPEALLAEIERKATSLGGEVEKRARAAMTRYADDAAKLSEMNNWLNVRMAEQEAANG